MSRNATANARSRVREDRDIKVCDAVIAYRELVGPSGSLRKDYLQATARINQIEDWVGDHNSAAANDLREAIPYLKKIAAVHAALKCLCEVFNSHQGGRHFYECLERAGLQDESVSGIDGDNLPMRYKDVTQRLKKHADALCGHLPKLG